MAYYTPNDLSKAESVSYQFIKVRIEKYICRITLNRPEKRNAFTPTMVNEIAFALEVAKENLAVRCIIIDAEGPVFCAGADLQSFIDDSVDVRNPSLPEPLSPIALGNVFRNLHKPSIAEVRGPVLAGGFLVIAGCTFVVCTPETYFALPEVKRGIWPMQVMASLLEVIPKRKMLEMCITGRNYSAEEALGMGLVTQIVSNEKINEEVLSLANSICANAPLAIRKGLEAFVKLDTIPNQSRHEFLKNQLEEILKSEDAQEGILAFKEKRSPYWSNN